MDFHYEVSRSLAAVEGRYFGRRDQGECRRRHLRISTWLSSRADHHPGGEQNRSTECAGREDEEGRSFISRCPESDILKRSGKTESVQAVLERVIERVPAPGGDQSGKFRALIFDSVYNVCKGSSPVRVVDGVKGTMSCTCQDGS